MATSRGASPADPTLAATTEDNSRGGLFVRSNIANPVEGVDISGTSIGDGTITLQLNGDTVGTFTTNQSTSDTINFVVSDSGGGSGNNNYVSSGEFNSSTNILTLMREGLQPLTFDLSSLAVTRTDAEINTLADNRIAAASLVRTVNGTAPDNAGNVSISGSGNTFADSDTVDFTVNSTTNEVTAQAMVRVGNGTASTTTLSSADSIIVDPATDFQIVEVGSSGVYVFQRIPVTPPPAPAAPPSFTAPPATSAITPSPEETITFTAPTGNTVTAVDMVSVNDPDGNPVTGVTSDTTSITIPAGAANAPGDYDISARVTTMNDASGETRMTTETPELVRYIPFFQSRTEITDTTDSSVTASTAGWTGGFTAIAGRGTIYLAVLATEVASTVIQADQNMFPVRVGHVGTLSVEFADGVSRTFNQFRVQGAAGQTINNFR